MSRYQSPEKRFVDGDREPVDGAKPKRMTREHRSGSELYDYETFEKSTPVSKNAGASRNASPSARLLPHGAAIRGQPEEDDNIDPSSSSPVTFVLMEEDAEKALLNPFVIFLEVFFALPYYLNGALFREYGVILTFGHFLWHCIVLVGVPALIALQWYLPYQYFVEFEATHDDQDSPFNSVLDVLLLCYYSLKILSVIASLKLPEDVDDICHIVHADDPKGERGPHKHSQYVHLQVLFLTYKVFDLGNCIFVSYLNLRLLTGIHDLPNLVEKMVVLEFLFLLDEFIVNNIKENFAVIRRYHTWLFEEQTVFTTLIHCCGLGETPSSRIMDYLRCFLITFLITGCVLAFATHTHTPGEN